LYYRPGIKIFLEAMGALFGLEPAGYHLASMLCYAVLCFETYLIGFLLTERWHTAIAVAVIFLSLSVHGEVIFWISSLNGVVENILTLASLTCFILWHKRDKSFLLYVSLLFFIAALLIKESAIALPIILIMYSFLLGGDVRFADGMKRIAGWCWPFLLISIIFIAIRSIVMRQAELPPPLTHFQWQTLIIGPWHTFLMTVSPIDWVIPVHFFSKFASMGMPSLIIALLGLFAVAFIPLILRKYRTTLLLWWIPTAAAPLFALGLVPSERHVVISSVAASILIALALLKLSEWLSHGVKLSSLIIACVLVVAFSVSGLYSLKHRQKAWGDASDVTRTIVEKTMIMYPIPDDDTTFFFLNVPDSIDGAFVFRFDNLGYALKLFYGNDSLVVVRIVTLDKIPDAALASREAAYFKIGAMGGYVYVPDDHLQVPHLKERWERLERLDILRNDFRYARNWERYSASPFILCRENTLAPKRSDELRKVLDRLYSLL